MTQKNLRVSAMLTVLSLLVVLTLLMSATYAWFTLSPDANVEPMQGSVSKGDVNLLIAAAENGTYDVTSPITRLDRCTALLPVSTMNLTSFYAPTAHTRDGKAAFYTDVTTKIDTRALHGEVYLKAQHANAELYFDREKLVFSGSSQLLTSLRLGLKIGEKIFFFKLDDFADGAAVSQNTIAANEGSVISAVDGNGNADYAPDPAQPILDYCAVQTKENEAPQKGKISLGHLSQEIPLKVEFWLYMEGCDENCLNDAQTKDVRFNLAFAAVETDARIAE